MHQRRLLAAVEPVQVHQGAKLLDRVQPARAHRDVGEADAHCLDARAVLIARAGGDDLDATRHQRAHKAAAEMKQGPRVIGADDRFGGGFGHG